MSSPILSLMAAPRALTFCSWVWIHQHLWPKHWERGSDTSVLWRIVSLVHWWEAKLHELLCCYISEKKISHPWISGHVRPCYGLLTSDTSAGFLKPLLGSGHFWLLAPETVGSGPGTEKHPFSELAPSPVSNCIFNINEVWFLFQVTCPWCLLEIILSL